MVIRQFLPKEHGLTVSWGTTLFLSVLLADKISLSGVLLVMLIIPTITLYDPVLGAIRKWKAKQKSLGMLFDASLRGWQKILIALIFGAVVSEVFLGYLPVLAVLAPVVAIVIFLVTMKYLPERSLFSRFVSIILVLSQFILLESALTGAVSSQEIQEFVFLSLTNVIIVLSVGQIVNARISKVDPKGKIVRTEIPLALGTVLVLLAISIRQPQEFVIYSSVAIISMLSYAMAANVSIKILGALSTVWNSLTILTLAVLHFI